MKEFERQEIAALPPKYRPLSAWGYFGYTLLFSIPLLGLVCLIVFALSDSSIARRNFARSYFCTLVLALIAFALLLSSGLLAGAAANWQ